MHGVISNLLILEMDKLSMSLDDFIKQNKEFRVSRRRGRGVMKSNFKAKSNPRSPRNKFLRTPQNRYSPYKSRGNIDDQWEHDLYEGDEGFSKSSSFSGSNDVRLLISNLDFGVSDYDLTELFSEFGSLISAEVHYDRSGRSLGTAEVVFKNKSSAVEAINSYNGVPLDGRPMNIQFQRDNELNSFTPMRNRSRSTPINRRRRGGPRRNPIRGRSSGNWNRKRNEVTTAEQLDAELDRYVRSG